MTLLLLQMSIVLLVTLLCGWIARKLGQTRVIGKSPDWKKAIVTLGAGQKIEGLFEGV